MIEKHNKHQIYKKSIKFSSLLNLLILRDIVEILFKLII